jgi:hypothetical protein
MRFMVFSRKGFPRKICVLCSSFNLLLLRYFVTKDSETVVEVQSLLALSPPNSSVITEVVDEGGWIAPVCRKKKDMQFRRSKQRLSLVVDGCWRRPIHRWIDLGSAAKDHKPP